MQSIVTNVSVICRIAEYMVLRIGIFFKILLKIFNNLFPRKDKDIQPIKVIKNKDINISRPGISYGK